MKNSARKVLLTGAFGSVGLSVLKELIKRKYKVRVLELYNSRNLFKSLSFLNKIEIIWGNLLNEGDVKKAVKGVDVVIHMAAIIPPLADENPDLSYKVNVEGTRNIVKAIEEISLRSRPKLIYTSSIAIYGDRRNNPEITVNDPPNPNDEYGRHKLQAEMLIRNSDVQWSIFRLSYITAMDTLKMNYLMFEMPLDTKIEICDPDDVALALVNAIDNPDVWGRIFNIAGGEKCRTTYKEYLENMMALFGMGDSLPSEAFSNGQFHCGWMKDSVDADKILHYQRHTLDGFYKRVKKRFAGLRAIITMFRPFARLVVLSYSKHFDLSKNWKSAVK